MPTQDPLPPQPEARGSLREVLAALGDRLWELVRRVCIWPPRHWLRLLDTRIHGPWIKVGDFYEDCSFHVRVCTASRMREDYIAGISLLDGHGPSGCSPTHCGVIKVSAKVAMEARQDPRAYFEMSMTRFGIPADELEQAADKAMGRLESRG